MNKTPDFSSLRPERSVDERWELMKLRSLEADIYACFVPSERPSLGPPLIVSHGAGEFKENYFEMARSLAKQGVSCLLLDMHGHGQSGGKAYHVSMKEWVADLQAALDYLETRPDVDPKKIAAFGLSSGGTAILEAAVIDPRLKALIALDATVMNTLPWSITLTMASLSAVGYLKRWLTGSDLRISIVQMLEEVQLAADPEINARLKVDPGKLRAFANFPLPGASAAFFVNTIQRVSKISAATLIIWGEQDNLDPVSTAYKLHDALTCVKHVEVIEGNGHAGHLDRNRQRVFDLTGDWLLKHLA